MPTPAVRSLTLSQAIRNAIDAEHAASMFYQRLAERTQDAVPRKFFLRMQEVEARHASEIEQRGRSLVESLPPKAAGNIALVETAPEWADSEGVGLDGALRIALEAELQAALYYDCFADALAEPGRTFFRSLAAAEQHHATLVRRAIEREDSP
jgi:rubrerythrin